MKYGGYIKQAADNEKTHYTIFVCCALDNFSVDKRGAAGYIILDKNGDAFSSYKSDILGSTSNRLLLLSIWSSLMRIPSGKNVRIVTNNIVIIQTLSKKNIGNESNTDLKANIVTQLSRLGKVIISKPGSATDNSYFSECHTATSQKLYGRNKSTIIN